MKKSFWLSMVVGVALILLVALLVAIFVPPVQTVLANTLSGNTPAGGPPWARMWHGGWGNGSGFALPAELQGLTSIPADQRFAHFDGVQINLKDQNNHPVTVNVIPGKVTASSATSLIIAANSGGTQTFTLNNQTMIHAMAASTPAPAATPASSTALQKGDDVVVVTLNNNTTATAVLAGGTTGFRWPGYGGWWGTNGKSQ
jgi:hypothetical protein